MDIVPTWASLEGNITMPDPIMLMAVSTVSCSTLIFLTSLATLFSEIFKTILCKEFALASCMCLNIFLMLRAQHIAVCAYPSVILCLEVDTLQLGCKTGKSINSILK